MFNSFNTMYARQTVRLRSRHKNRFKLTEFPTESVCWTALLLRRNGKIVLRLSVPYHGNEFKFGAEVCEFILKEHIGKLSHQVSHPPSPSTEWWNSRELYAPHTSLMHWTTMKSKKTWWIYVCALTYSCSLMNKHTVVSFQANKTITHPVVVQHRTKDATSQIYLYT